VTACVFITVPLNRYCLLHKPCSRDWWLGEGE